MTSDKRKPDDPIQIHLTPAQKPKIITDNQRQSAGKKSRGRVPGKASFPRKTIDEALRVPQSIWTNNAGNPFPLGDLQKSLNIDKRGFRALVRASELYGLTAGSWSTNPNSTIKLTDLGSAIVAPKIDDDPKMLKIEALQKPKTFRDFLQAIDNRVIPPQERCESTLIQQYSVGSSVAKLCYSVLIRNVRMLGLVVNDDKHTEVLRLDNPLTETTTTQPEQTQESFAPCRNQARRADRPKKIHPSMMTNLNRYSSLTARTERQWNSWKAYCTGSILSML